MSDNKIKAVGYCRFSSDHQKELSIEAKQRAIEKLKVVYSTEKPIKPDQNLKHGGAGAGRRETPGSVSFVPSVSGLIIAGEVVRALVGDKTK